MIGKAHSLQQYMKPAVQATMMPEPCCGSPVGGPLVVSPLVVGSWQLARHGAMYDQHIGSYVACITNSLVPTSVLVKSKASFCFRPAKAAWKASRAAAAASACRSNWASHQLPANAFKQGAKPFPTVFAIAPSTPEASLLTVL